MVGDEEERASPLTQSRTTSHSGIRMALARAAGPFRSRVLSASATTSTWQALSNWGENACPPEITFRPSCESRFAKAR